MNGIMKECDMRNERRGIRKADQAKLHVPCAYESYRSETCNEESAPMSELVAPNCNASAFSMAAVAGGLLMCLGIILYAILTQ